MVISYLDSTANLMGVIRSCINETSYNTTQSATISGQAVQGGLTPVTIGDLDAYEGLVRYYVRSIRVQSLHPFDIVYSSSDVSV